MVNIIKKTVSGLLLLLAMCFWAQKTNAQPGVSVSIQTFYDELEPYGQWINDPELGYVWAPDAGPDFKPYATNGHWAATEFGNTWVSDYDWGWAAFHYGRWRFANDYGWEWIPGTEWGPAWVNWRTGGDYYGWAPLGPGTNIDLSFGANYYQPDNYWVFAPRRYVYEPNIYRYYLPANRNLTIIHNTTIISNVYSNNNRRYIAGPRPDDVRRYTNAPVNIYNINDSRRPGGARIRNNTLNIYRPQIASNQNNDNRPEPNRVINRGSYNRNQSFSNNDNRNQNLNNGRQPVNQGNPQNVPSNNNGFGRNYSNQGNPQNVPSNNNTGFGRISTNAPSGNQLPQRVFPNHNQTNPNPNNTINGQAPGSATNPNNPSTPVGGRSNPSNQPAQMPSGQPNNNWRQSRDFDHNRTRNDLPVQQNQNQQNQQQMQQRQTENQQRQQQNQQEMQQRQQQNQQQMQQRQMENQQRQQQNQQEMQQRQQTQQQNQQRQQEMQQRQQNQQQNQQRQQQNPQTQTPREQPQQQRPARQETPERNSTG